MHFGVDVVCLAWFGCTGCIEMEEVKRLGWIDEWMEDDDVLLIVDEEARIYAFPSQPPINQLLDAFNLKISPSWKRIQTGIEPRLGILEVLEIQ